ncbi:fimbrial protein [Stenotrophomonas sp.]|uniref:fimbrial protein n=1 Tax=Stenotrophomonas sp. TaxID=69392 RepID=UPI0028ABD7ED|nr:fimbrial protein [Stenotrophomonas sp.]
MMMFNDKQKATPRRGHRWHACAIALLAGLGMADAAQACVKEWHVPRTEHKVIDTYPTDRERHMGQLAWAFTFDGCVQYDPFDVDVRFEMPGMTYVGEITFKGITYPAFEANPEAPLMIFLFQEVVGFPELPMRPGITYPYRVGAMSSVPTFNPTFNLRPQYFSRGGRMRSYASTGRLVWNVARFPHLDGELTLDHSFTFPAVTCPLQDKAETLQDVQTAELAVPGSTAKEKLVAIRMDCGVDPPRARMTLSDAGDAGNTGSQLTPTADSDAEGVRVQLLRGGAEVQFGQTWEFDPGVGGVHDHQFTARYIRTNEALVPGTIKGEAVLNVDYW